MSKNVAEENLEKYQNPIKYDELYEGYKEDLAFIMEKVKSVQTPIIELACGTGRLTIPLAEQGYELHAVDIHRGMLDLAKNKAKEKSVTVAFYQQDCTKLNLPVKSSFIFMTGNSFQHFLTNESQDALFQSVKSHLNEKGEFIFDTRNPILKELAETEEYEETFLNAKNQKVIEKNREVYDHQLQILHCKTDRQIFENGDIITTEQDSISLRYTYPMELTRILEQNGFELVALYGDWKKASFTEDSVSMVVHCRLK